ncbi:MAG TPA: GNAT family N-acetyltransferase [Leptolyngbyaceae cyanobacterium M33_DOE_097]|uniref:GNAT family N-acetyltransferase n=1 Tax=Oscillatoriales cyanobacterium SpSt-418 TaxID=2282169 RepID=A0A7C3PBH9_9CYAN|nr:GNAT family N-acetyltransferase [Leptolyngbyaceae cyanobacterium M33_DOE_097]
MPDPLATAAIALLQTPELKHCQLAADWLANHSHTNPELEFVLNLCLRSQTPPQTTGDQWAIAHPPVGVAPLSKQTIQGIVIARPGNASVALEGSDRAATEALLNLIQTLGCPQRIVTSSQAKAWIRPILLRHYQLAREHNPLVMVCSQPVGEATGRWALAQDKTALQAYAEAYRAERGSGNLNQNWDALIARQQVAVLEHNGEIVSVIKRGSTLNAGLILGTFTFAQYRRQGFAQKLLVFLTRELLKEYTSVKLWVDEDNETAIALYQTVGFQVVGASYTGYFKC